MVNNDDGAPKKASTSKAFAPFKSPMGSKSKASLPSSDDRIKEMKQEIAALEMQLQGKDAEKIVAEHIRLLHLYNDCKDAASTLLSQLAVKNEVTYAEIYERFGIKPTD